ncbi:hypothetical protein B0H13DRAFT_1855156 [Mycena leptocephala]|nr:hypothetical protein B0H13DRAFT_1855156 [Mycena leptocephala]
MSLLGKASNNRVKSKSLYLVWIVRIVNILLAQGTPEWREFSLEKHLRANFSLFEVESHSEETSGSDVPLPLQLKHKFIKLPFGTGQGVAAMGTIQEAAVHDRTISRVSAGSIAEKTALIGSDVMRLGLVNHYNKREPTVHLPFTDLPPGSSTKILGSFNSKVKRMWGGTGYISARPNGNTWFQRRSIGLHQVVENLTPLNNNAFVWNDFAELGIDTWEFNKYAHPTDPHCDCPPFVIPLSDIQCQVSRGLIKFMKPPIWITTTMDRARPNLLDIMTDSKLPFTDNRGKMRKAAAFRFRIFAPVLQKRALLSVGPIRLEPSSLDSEVITQLALEVSVHWHWLEPPRDHGSTIDKPFCNINTKSQQASDFRTHMASPCPRDFPPSLYLYKPFTEHIPIDFEADFQVNGSHIAQRTQKLSWNKNILQIDAVKTRFPVTFVMATSKVKSKQGVDVNILKTQQPGQCSTTPQHQKIQAYSVKSTDSPWNIATKTDAFLFDWYDRPENEHEKARFSFAMACSTKLELPEAILAGFKWDNLPKNSVVVDVGGGGGSTALIIANAFPHLSVVVQDRKYCRIC